MKCIKKIFIFLLIGIFMISMASAFEFDNVKSYDPINREVTITNVFGLGGVIGKARLNTPLNVKTNIGYQKVAEFDIFAYEDYNDAIKQFIFTDLKQNKKINRNYDLKYLTYGNILIEDFDNIKIGETENGTEIYNWKKIGEHYDYGVIWKKITPADLKKNKRLTIGVFTDVQRGDYVDWIPIIYGVEVKEWASWEDAVLMSPINMTSSTEPSPYVTNESSAITEAWKCFDSDAGTWWQTSETVPSTHGWATLDMGEGNDFIATNITIVNINDFGQASVRLFAFQGSSDEATWVNLTTGENPTGTANTTYDFTDNEVSYRYYRQYVYTDYGAGNVVGCGNEFLIYGFLETINDTAPNITLNSPSSANYSTNQNEDAGE